MRWALWNIVLANVVLFEDVQYSLYASSRQQLLVSTTWYAERLGGCRRSDKSLRNNVSLLNISCHETRNSRKPRAIKTKNTGTTLCAY